MSKWILLGILLFVPLTVRGQTSDSPLPSEPPSLEEGKIYELGSGFSVVFKSANDNKYMFLYYPELCYDTEIKDFACSKFIIRKIFKNSFDEKSFELSKRTESLKRYGIHYTVDLSDKFLLVIVPMFKDSQRIQIIGAIMTIESKEIQQKPATATNR